MNVQFLGTGCAQPTKERNHAGVLLTFGTERILFDCGEGIQRQMRVAGVKPAKITRLCITHFHGDHVFGIPGLLSSMGADQFAKKLHVYGPKGIKSYFNHIWKWFAAKDIIEHEVHEVTSGVFFENDAFSLEVEKVDHSVACVGYKFREKERLRIDVKKAKKVGLEGPILGKLQKGENVRFKGSVIQSVDVTYPVKGRTFAYVTDTKRCNGVDLLAKDTDTLVIEGTFLDNLKKNALKTKHLTVKQAALIAAENNVGKLIITHISQRYKNANELREEAQHYFDDVVVAEDFMKVTL
ncbi:ribonuclease Z [archaeon]|nr:ribonuclease Z [archaeon]